MLTVDEHLARILELVRPLPELELTLLDAHGCTLAEDVTSRFPLPQFDNSAMDGYAVRSDDVAGAAAGSPITLHVVGDVAAGSPPTYRVQPGLCVRIMTGAPMPPGADAVVPVEDTDGGIAQVRIHAAPSPGAHIRRAGEDVVAGQLVLPAGTHLGAAQVALAAAVGRDRLLVHPRPRVVVMSTGAELREPGTPLEPGQIVDSNSYGLTCAVKEAGAIAYRVGITSDDPREFRDALDDQLVRADCIITSGGVSQGAYDVVKEVLAGSGTVAFDRVAMQPGMPQGFGTVGPDGIPFFGLPGNPVSAMISFEVFVRPALRRMQGGVDLHRPTVLATLEGTIRSTLGRRQFLRGQVRVAGGAYVVSLVGGSGSHLLAGYAAANALVVVPEDVSELAAGAAVSCLMLERRRS